MPPGGPPGEAQAGGGGKVLPRRGEGCPAPSREEGLARLGSGGMRRGKGAGRGAKPGLLTWLLRPGRRRARGGGRALPGSRAGGSRRGGGRRAGAAQWRAPRMAFRSAGCAERTQCPSRNKPGNTRSARASLPSPSVRPRAVAHAPGDSSPSPRRSSVSSASDPAGKRVGACDHPGNVFISLVDIGGEIRMGVYFFPVF